MNILAVSDLLYKPVIGRESVEQTVALKIVWYIRDGQLEQLLVTP